MNCKLFRATAAELASSRPLQESMRSAALVHAGHCEACAKLLADHTALSGGLRALGRSRVPVPHRIEADLLSAFSRHHSAANSGPRPVRRPGRQLWEAAAAAALVLAFALIEIQLGRLFLPDRALEAPAAADLTDSNLRPARDLDHINTKGGEESGNPVDSREGEVATDFLLLTRPTDSLLRMEGGQLLRIQLPRAALVSFGLPVNFERIEEPVKADLLLGSDGVARAIRFVH